MKKIFLIFLLLIFFSTKAQTYNIIIIEKPRTVSPLNTVRYLGRVQNEMQTKFDYNHKRIDDAMTNISNQIIKLNYPENLRANIAYGWKQIIKEVDNCMGGDAMLSSPNVSNIISQMTTSVNRVISNEVRLYNQSRTYNNYNFEFCNKQTYSYSNNYNAAEFGKSNLNYKFSFGYGIGLNSKSSSSENVNEISATLRISKKATLENLFEKFTSNNQNNIPEDDFKKQFAITSIYNYHTSFFSQSLFIVTGVGISYSKNYISNDKFENKINPVINLGIDYNFKKIPFSLGLYDKLDYFGNFSSTGFIVKYLLK